MSSPIPPPPTYDWLYTFLYRVLFAFFHAALTFITALFCKHSSRRPSFSPACNHYDPEQGEQHNRNDDYVNFVQVPAPVSHQSSPSTPTHQRNQQHLQQQRPLRSKKNVQFEKPIRRACPPLGRIDLLSSPASLSSSSSGSAGITRGRMQQSLDKIRTTTSHSRTHHATYFLD
ncbi:hypothetical protein HJC23_003443 [Cyclotella cryptica]|uniref:Uncharacterized protein n=1 Tax=Cyclotella cryptica TaxID=29204 RepID=A0ABD3QS33_9STRA